MFSTLIDFLLILIVLLIALYYYGKSKYSTFKGRMIKTIDPAIPFLGNTAKLYCQIEHTTDFLMSNYAIFPEQKYIGLFELQRPLIFLRDLQIIKQITIKDFDHFVNHRNLFPENSDPFFVNVLFFLKGDRWRDMRASLSPAFTSSKMRNMFHLIDDCAKNVLEYYNGEINNSGKNFIEIEVKNEISKFTNDVIATSAYGLNIDSFRNKDNEFYRMGKEGTTILGIQMLKIVGFTLIPKFMKFFNITLLSKRVMQFFRGVVLNTMRYRDDKNIVRHDMIHLLMQVKKGSLKYEQDVTDSSDVGYAAVQESALGKREVKRTWTDDELVGQAFLFYFGGFDTVATLLTFFFYEMVRNPDIQEKLRQEINEHICQHDGKLVYDDLQKLKYLDMCITETLRLWPPAMFIDRVCTKKYNLTPANESTTTPFTVYPGENIWIPLYAIHRDAKYYPDPERFDPERFSDENKSSLNPMAYMPFGIGPRNCIGSRFALMVIKVIVFHMLEKFEFVTTEKTVIPVVLLKSSMNVYAKDGVHVALKQRSIK